MHTQPLLLQYLFFLLLVTLSTLAFHLPIRILCSLPPGRLPHIFRQVIPHYPHANALSTALLVSSCTKLFPILLIIWEYDLRSSAAAVGWAVLVNNVAAVEILVGCGYLRAGAMVGVGAVVRGCVQGTMLRAVGLEDEGGLLGGFGGLVEKGRSLLGS